MLDPAPPASVWLWHVPSATFTLACAVLVTALGNPGGRPGLWTGLFGVVAVLGAATLLATLVPS